ncbi:MAG: type II toxin-antitoxin system prevent-host-death family antitoxin [Candidatus Desantisbacteria bacterium]
MLTKTIDIHDAQSKLPELLSFALEGNDVIIVEDNKPLVRLVSISMPNQSRIAGLNKGKIGAGEDFDEPLPDEFWTGAM